MIIRSGQTFESTSRSYRLQWKSQLLESAAELFTTAAERRGSEGSSLKDLQAKIGQLAMENDFLSGALGRMGDASGKR